MNQLEIQHTDRSVTPKMVHLEDFERDDRALCGAPVTQYLSDAIQVDCVVCAELARADGYDV